MEPTKAYEHLPILKWTIFILKVMGGYQIRRNVLSYFTMLSLAFLVFEIQLDMILNWNGVETLKRVVFLPSVSLTTIKGFFLILQSKDFIHIVDLLKQFWSIDKFEEESSIQLNKVIVLVTRIWKAYVIMVLSFCTLMTCLPMIMYESKVLILSNFAFCDLKGNLTCWIANYIWQGFLMNFQAIPASLGFDLMFVIFTGYIYIGCEMIKIGLKRLNTTNITKRKFILREIVDQHDFLLKFVSTMNDMYTRMMFMQFYCSLLSLILVLYMIVADGVPPKFENVSYFGTLYSILACQLFIYAYSGTIIQTQIRSMTTYIFNVDWYKEHSTHLREDLSLMILRAQNATILNAGKMSDLNLELFVVTLKNSFSAFTLIWQVSNAEPDV
ncbi:uncharacterized protein [Atheta coriaria]|uniref:uncharacterized protein n=1 Tax=Dalotia coriaria TaxID=877792 RepID=UPI0031F45408